MSETVIASTVQGRASAWKRVPASILDFLTVFIAGGIAIARLTGDLNATGFKLEGGPALVLFALIVAYFIVGRKLLGGTLWDRVFRIRRPQPK